MIVGAYQAGARIAMVMLTDCIRVSAMVKIMGMQSPRETAACDRQGQLERPVKSETRVTELINIPSETVQQMMRASKDGPTRYLIHVLINWHGIFCCNKPLIVLLLEPSVSAWVGAEPQAGKVTPPSSHSTAVGSQCLLQIRYSAFIHNEHSDQFQLLMFLPCLFRTADPFSPLYARCFVHSS